VWWARSGEAAGADPIDLYLGQQPPAETPQIFAPNIISKPERNEVNGVFSPDGGEFCYSVFKPGFGYTMFIVRREKGQWTDPEPLPFASDYSEVDMSYHPDGTRMFYLSKRPIEPGGERAAGYQIWAVDRRGESWGEPFHLGPNVNAGSRQLFPTATTKGDLYFNSDKPGGYGEGDLYKSVLKESVYGLAQNLGPAVNSAGDETDVLVAPDASFIIFTAQGRPDVIGSGDLYISFALAQGGWTQARHLDPPINGPSSEFCPALSPDGKYFFFVSGRAGIDDIYWVDAGFVDEVRAKTMK
jgi:Tol biopolymer transport system component